uniref:Uncharacterized protein n=1 Tax=Plectus sambesii TaxID=2011161 RepID=A0A914XK75_9BILA
MSFGLIDQSPLTSLQVYNRSETCTFRYATVFPSTSMSLLPRPNFLLIKGLTTLYNIPFTKYLPFIVHSDLDGRLFMSAAQRRLHREILRHPWTKYTHHSLKFSFYDSSGNDNY